MWFQIRTAEIPGKMVFNGCLSCFARLQGSSHPRPGCTDSQWLGNTPGFFCPGHTCPENTYWKGLSAPLSINGSLSLCSPVLSGHHRPLVGQAPCSPPALGVLSASLVSMATAECQVWSWCTPQHCQLPLAPSEVGSRSWSCPQDPVCRTLCMARPSCRESISEPLCRKRALPPSREAHEDIFSRAARQTSSALPAIHLLHVF